MIKKPKEDRELESEKKTDNLSQIKPYFIYINRSCNIYIFWILIHYISANMYAKYCTPLTLSGFVMSPFLVSSTHCKAFKWMILHGSSTLESMWIILGTWICSKIIINI